MKLRLLVTLGTAAIGAIAFAAAPLGASGTPQSDHVVLAQGPLTDFSLATAEPTDGANAQVLAVDDGTSTKVTMVVNGLDRGAAAQVHGAHVHIGPCVEGNGAAALGHYNIGGGISDATEVWLDFEITGGGTAIAQARVPFVIPAGAAQSVVIHAAPTNPTSGAAGARLACLPVAF